jgi:hypothetical protein
MGMPITIYYPQHALARRFFAGLTLAVLPAAGTACTGSATRSTDSAGARLVATTHDSSAHSPTCGADVRRVVTELGTRMRLVSVLAQPPIVTRALADAYDSLVTKPLLDEWRSNPRSAPGREVSNPWPARIEVRSIEREGTGCRANGDAVYVLTSDTTRAVRRRAMSLLAGSAPQPRVSEFRWIDTVPAQPAPVRHDSAAQDVRDAAEVVRQYYRDIQNRDFDAAYERWSDGGHASGKTRDGFAAGFANTMTVAATVSDTGAVEGAAGSQFATAIVRVDATLRSGEHQHFAGTYTLRRTMVDGATPQQRQWHIFKAKLRKSP